MDKEAAPFGSELGPRVVFVPASMLDLWDAGVRQAIRANHNPPAASSAAIARDKCLAFILFALIPASPSLSLRHCARISRKWLSIWNEGGEFRCEPPASRNEPNPERID
jgi:hypothetical protein